MKDPKAYLRAESDASLEQTVTIESVPASALVFPESGSLDLSWAKKGPVQRVMSRYIARRADFAFSTAYLEGSTFTLPEVQTLLDGYVPAGKTDGEIGQILRITEASEYVLDVAGKGSFTLKSKLSDELNYILTQDETIAPGVRRHESNINSDGKGATVSGPGFEFHGMKKDELEVAERVFQQRLDSIEHPVLRGATYAAMQTYAQFYFDGNKRTARYMMDAELLSNGYDAAEIPASRKDEYNQALSEMFTTGDTMPYVAFLLDVIRRASS